MATLDGGLAVLWLYFVGVLVETLREKMNRDDTSAGKDGQMKDQRKKTG